MEKKMSRRGFLKASAATGAILSMTRTSLAQEPKRRLSMPTEQEEFYLKTISDLERRMRD